MSLRRRRRYTRISLAFWLAGLATVASVNVCIDPYCAYRLAPDLFVEYRPTYYRPETKAEQVIAQQPKVIITGTSRSLCFDPEWPEWRQEPTYNLGLRGSTQDEVAKALRFAIETAPVKRVFLCICFSQYETRPNRPGFARSRFSNSFSPWSYHLENLLSADALEASYDTVRSRFKHQLSRFTALGAARDDEAIAESTPRRRFLATIAEYAQLYGNFDYSDRAIESLRGIVRLCRQRNIELTVTTTPVHALHLETAAARGLWPQYERWIRDAAIAVEEESGGQVHLWDFGGYNRYTTEAAPVLDDSPPLRYYIESSHFTPALARRMLARVNHAPDADASFGVELTRDNVDARIAELQRERTAWLNSRPRALVLLGQAFPERMAKTPLDRGGFLQ